VVGLDSLRSLLCPDAGPAGALSCRPPRTGRSRASSAGTPPTNRTMPACGISTPGGPRLSFPRACRQAANISSGCRPACQTKSATLRRSTLVNRLCASNPAKLHAPLFRSFAGERLNLTISAHPPQKHVQFAARPASHPVPASRAGPSFNISLARGRLQGGDEGDAGVGWGDGAGFRLGPLSVSEAGPSVSTRLCVSVCVRAPASARERETRNRVSE